MPAIQPDRLKAQVSLIGDDFMQPARYVGRLHDLLDFYADRIRRPGQLGSRVPILPHYNTPIPVIREVQRSLAVQANAAGPDAALSLVDALWADGSYEMRIIAAFLVSRSALTPGMLAQRLSEWIQPNQDFQIVTNLLESGYAGLGPAHPEIWIDLIRYWLSTDRGGMQSVALQATSLVVRDPSFENIPPIFTLLTPVIQSAPVALHTELTNLVQQLAMRNPTETAFFLRKALSVSPDRSITRLVRRCLPFFDPPIQQTLREALAARLALG
ncbi:MAG TPA: DNA alkylation repair protein [Anaerolineaceae bacterium]|jgi:hypothetical protein